MDGLGLLSVLNEVFLCYHTLLDTDTLYGVVQHACCYKACNSELYYVNEITYAFIGKTVTLGADMATMFQTFKVSEGHTQVRFLLQSRQRPVSEIL